MSTHDEDSSRAEATITLKIENFSKTEGAISSSPCMIRNLEWTILVQNLPTPGVYLECKGETNSNSKWSCYVQAELILVSQKEGVKNFMRELHGFFHSQTHYNCSGFKNFGSSKYFTDPKEGYINNDTVIFQAYVQADTAHSVIFDLPASPNPADKQMNTTFEHPKLVVTRKAAPDNAYKVFQKLNDLRKKKLLCDVNIVVNDTIFPCHRNILASVCKYFEAMFTNNFEKQNESDVKLLCVKAKIFEEILDFMYMGEICIDHENVCLLLMTSDYLGLKYVEKLCIAYLENHVPDHDIARICTFSVQKGYKSLIEGTLRPYIEKNFVTLSQDLLNLSSVVLMDILTPACIKSNVNEVISFLSEWVEVNQKTEFVFELLKSVDDLSVPLNLSCLSKIITTMMQVMKLVDYVPDSEGEEKVSDVETTTSDT